MNPSGLLSTFSLGRPFHDLWEESWTQQDIVPGLEELIQFIRWEGLLPVWGHEGARAGALRSTANLTEEKEEYKLSRPNSRRVPASQCTLLAPGPSQVEGDVAWAQGGGASCGLQLSFHTLVSSRWGRSSPSVELKWALFSGDTPSGATPTDKNFPLPLSSQFFPLSWERR